MTKDEINNLTLEETFSQVDELMDKLSNDDIPLEESFSLYKEGMEMLSHCKSVIEKVEKKVTEIASLNEEVSE